MSPTITTEDGLQLHARLWKAERPRGTLVISHGLGEHSGCYELFAEAMALEAGLVDVLAHDYRGHGLSPGRRGVVRRYEELRLDLQAVLDWNARERPGRPQFVLGHSNGGQVALHAVLGRESRIDGLILSNPSLALATEVPRWKLQVGRVLNRVAPWVTLSSDLGEDTLTRDTVVTSQRKFDRLRHARVSAPLFFGMVAGGLQIARRADEVRLPTLMLLGESDPIVDVQANRDFFENLGAPDKTLRGYPDMLHEPLNEIGREDVLADLVAWLAERLSPAVSTT